LDLFEFILVITSVVYALAMAQVLTGVGRLAQTEATIQWFLPHTLWIVILFMSILVTWWAGWEFREVEWVFPKYVYMLITPISFFFSSSLIIPQRTDGQEVNLEKHFLKIKGPALWAYFIGMLAQFADGPLLASEPLWFPGRVLQIGALSAVLLGILTEKGRLQALSSAGLLLFFIYVTLTRFWAPG
jgi:hypothetical protein